MLASQVTKILLHCNCHQPSSCGTKRCSCFKSGVKCTNYCHQSNDVTDAYLNLASKEDRKTQQVISRSAKKISQSTSELSARPTCDKERTGAGTN